MHEKFHNKKIYPCVTTSPSCISMLYYENWTDKNVWSFSSGNANYIQQWRQGRNPDLLYITMAPFPEANLTPSYCFCQVFPCDLQNKSSSSRLHMAINTRQCFENLDRQHRCSPRTHLAGSAALRCDRCSHLFDVPDIVSHHLYCKCWVACHVSWLYWPT